MNPLHENAVLNFDLDFLQPAANNNPNLPALKLRYISQLKRRIVRVDALQANRNAINAELSNKTKELEETKKKLESTTQEYTRTSLDYKEALESCTRFDNENQELKATVRRLQDECIQAVNDFEAGESHKTQLQQLVKQQERKIEALEKVDRRKSDKLIEDSLRAKNKEYEKEILFLKKKCEALNKEVQYAKCDYNKLNEKLQQKHEKLNNEALSDSKSVDVQTENNQDSSPDNVETTLQSPNKNKDIISMELDTDCGNEVVCVDMGYGSSLASSDNEKWINSPDYVFSPINGDSNENVRKNILVNIATSPILPVKMIDVATSPIMSVKMTAVATSPIMSVTMAHVATSPITIQIETNQVSKSQPKSAIMESKLNEKYKTGTTSPIKNIIPEIVASSVKVLKNTPHTNMQEKINDVQKTAIKTFDNIPRLDIQEVQGIHEKECLELHNSNELNVDCSTDKEIEMILKTMQFNHKLITPIPRTPAQTRCPSASSQGATAAARPCAEAAAALAQAAAARAQAAAARAEAAAAREQAAIVKKENKKIQMMLDNLGKDMFIIKSFLKNRFSMPDTAEVQNDHPLPRNSLFHDDDSIDVNTHNNACSDHVSSNHEKGLLVCSDSTTTIPLTRPAFSRDKKITIISDEIVKPANADTMTRTTTNIQVGDRLSQDTVLQMKLGNSTDQKVTPAKECVKDFSETMEAEMKSPTEDIKCKKGKKSRKLTNLAKYRLKCESRKYKIRTQTPPLKIKRHTKLKQLKTIQKTTQLEHSVSLNDANVYAKAVKVMAEINSKRLTEPHADVSSQNITSEVEDYNNKIKCKQVVTSSEPVNAVVRTAAKASEPLITSPRRSLRSPKANLSPNFSYEYQKTSKEEERNTEIKCKQVVTSSEPVIAVVRSAAKALEPLIISPRRSLRSPKGNLSPNFSFEYLKASKEEERNNVIKCKQVVTTSEPVHGHVHAVVGSAAKASEPSVTSARRSLRSPKANFSPVLSFEYRKPGIRNSSCCIAPNNPPTHSLISPDTAAAPLNHTIGNRKGSITTPEISYAFPKPANDTMGSIRSPDIITASSVCSIGSPDPTNASLNNSIRSPELAITCPNIAVMYPKAAITSPKTAFTSLQDSVMSPQASITSPRYEITSPKLITTSPKFSITSPKLSITSPRSSMTTRSQIKNESIKSEECFVLLYKDLDVLQDTQLDTNIEIEKNCNEIQLNNEPQFGRTARKRTHSNASDTECNEGSCKKQQKITEKSDEDIEKANSSSTIEVQERLISWHPKESILCVAIQKYGMRSLRLPTIKISEAITNYICVMIETYTLNVKEAMGKNKLSVMNELVQVIRKYDDKQFVSGLLQYLMKPERKNELYKKLVSLPAPKMTESEQVLLYLFMELRNHWDPVDIVEKVLSTIEHRLFRLNHTPECDVLETVSHFYALLCRYCHMKHRLITFMLDAMYCILFKSVVLIKQCLEVWPYVIPMANTGMAKTPLVMCFVYLLHFFNCEDRFNITQDIRNLLRKRYCYELIEWTEKEMLNYFENAIQDLKDVSNQKKMLRIALIVLGKRQGPQWARENIINKMFLPLIKNENVSENVKEFCISTIGSLMKPFPINMLAACDVIMNHLADILNTTISIKIQEAVITSLLMMSRQHQTRVNEILLTQKMRPMSADLEDLLRTYVRGQSLRGWFLHLAKMNTFVNNTFMI